MIRKSTFFRDVTLRICSSLDIEKALWQCLWYIQEIIPAGQMSLHLYDRETGIAETIAHATLEDYEALSIKTRLGRRGRLQIEERRTSRLHRIQNTSHDPVAKALCRQLGCLDLSAIIMDLVIEGKFLGVATFQSLSGEKFTKEHERLVQQLNEPFAVALTNSIRYRELQTLKDLLADDNQYLQKELRRICGDEVIGAEFGLKEVMELVRHVAPTASPALLLGDTGVGKELIASTIHSLSPRRDGPFIDVNCGAIPGALMDSELFGHEKGAFTGAIAQKRGRFERAQGGTIFLDEIGELTMDAQVRLLRVLQEKKIERIGGAESLSLDIRVIAATHRDLKKMMEEGNFREDLYFRLAVFPIQIPTLRERKSDIPSLVQHFLQKKSVQMKLNSPPKLAPDAIDRLVAYSWPGNVRELENAIERALILNQGEPITFPEISFGESGKSTNKMAESPVHSMRGGESISLETAMANHIRKALSLAKGKVNGRGGAAELLEINPRTLRHRMRKLGIPFGRKAMHIYK